MIHNFLNLDDVQFIIFFCCYRNKDIYIYLYSKSFIILGILFFLDGLLSRIFLMWESLILKEVEDDSLSLICELHTVTLLMVRGGKGIFIVEKPDKFRHMVKVNIKHKSR